MHLARGVAYIVNTMLSLDEMESIGRILPIHGVVSKLYHVGLSVLIYDDWSRKNTESQE